MRALPFDVSGRVIWFLLARVLSGSDFFDVRICLWGGEANYAWARRRYRRTPGFCFLAANPKTAVKF